MNPVSIPQQVVSGMVAALLGATEAEGRVFDSREAALARDEMPCIAITPPDEDTQPFSDGIDTNSVLVTLEVMVRDDDWRPVADRIAVAAHRIIKTDAALQALVVDLRKTRRTWEGAEADQTAGIDSITYKLIYLSPVNDLASTI